MNTIFGQPTPGNSNDPKLGDDEIPLASSGERGVPASGTEQAFFRLDLKRSLQLHWRLTRAIVIAFLVLAVAYFMVQVLAFKAWPAYMAQSVVYVQPTPAKVLPGGAPRWPFDSSTYETYIQQQMMNVSREDVLVAAVHKLADFKRPGESDQAAAQRLVRKLEVLRLGTAYEFSINARSGDPQTAAEIANAMTAAYIESASRDERTGDSQRLQMLSDERDRVAKSLAADRAEQDALNKQLGVAAVGTAIPDHYDEDIAQIRSELVKARADHDAAAAKFAAMDAGQGPSSAAIDAEADEIIASDAGLVSMKTALNTRRATLLSQMANLTPVNPQYKQDEEELVKINATLEAMMKDLRGKAAARIQLHLKADLQRTAGVESRLSAQLAQLAGAAGSATPKMQRSSDLAADIARLQARYSEVDNQVHNLMLEDHAPAAASQVSPAVAPLTRTKSGVLRNVLLIIVLGLFLGVLAAVTAHKLDPKVYIAADVEHVLGFAPMAQLPDFNDVSEAVAEEYMLRLSSAIEHARKQGNLRNCIFTGTGPGAGVSTLVHRVRKMLEAMGRSTLLVDATGARAGAPPVEGTQALVAIERVSRPHELLQQMAHENGAGEENLVLTDTAPLSVSAETEYLARFVDCAIVVIQSGVTTRAQLREAAATLQRLNVGAVGFVLNRMGKAKADPAFRASVEAVEKHLQTQGSQVARRTERLAAFVAEQAPAKEALPKDAQRARYEPELAAVAAAVARFSPPPAPDAAVCHSTPMVAVPVAEAAKRFSIPLVGADVSQPADPISSEFPSENAVPATPQEAAVPAAESATSSDFDAAAETIVSPVLASDSSVFPEPAEDFSFTLPADPGALFSSQPTSSAGSNALPAGPESPSSSSAASKITQGKWTERVPEQQPEPSAVNGGVAPNGPNPAPDMPWWLSDAPRNVEPTRPPVIWQPAQVSTSRQRAGDAPETQGANASTPHLAMPGGESVAWADEASANMNSRLSGLRSLLFVLGVKNTNGGQQQGEQRAGGGTDTDIRGDRQSYERSGLEPRENAERSVGGASPRPITALPEVLPPKPLVIDFDSGDGPVGEYPTRQDRRATADGVDILPSKRGQYKKI
jgi:uncharacterized protein involved in exopolysaccharide biosynthesis